MLLAPSPSAGYNSPVPPVSQTIRVTVLFFGRLKELTGHAEDSVEFSDATTIEQLFALYAARHPELAKYRSSVVASRNQEFAAWDTPLRAGDEVAFLPPVRDRKSTRLNSSHRIISYAVFCLKKKKSYAHQRRRLP